MTQEQLVAAQLREAQQLMNDQGAHWIQGNYQRRVDDGKMGYCSIGAINKALSQSSTKRKLAVITLAEVINPNLRKEYKKNYDDPEETYGYLIDFAEDQIIHWNDDDNRSWEDVKGAFSKAQRRLRDRARRKAKK